MRSSTSLSSSLSRPKMPFRNACSKTDVSCWSILGSKMRMYSQNHFFAASMRSKRRFIRQKKSVVLIASRRPDSDMALRATSG